MLLTTAQAAARLGVPPRTVRAWVKKGWLPCQRINERMNLIDEADLELVRERRKPGPKRKNRPL